MPTQEDELLTAPQAGEILGVGRRTVQRLAASGKLEPRQKLPGKTGDYLFARADVERLAAEKATA